MIKNAEYLRKEIADQERILNENKNRLATIERICHHKWLEPKQIFEDRIEYVNGTNIIRHGIDWWYEAVPRMIKAPVWTRTCITCGKVEKTEKTKDEIVKKPAF